MTADRNPGSSPVFRLFSELRHLPPDERRAELMLRLEHVWDEAKAKQYVTKKGKQVPSPDTAIMLKVVQAVAVLQGLTGQPSQGEAQQLEAMTDADLVREATKRLPPSEVAQLADALIALREQQRTNSHAIVTTGETTNEEHRSKPRRRSAPKAGESERSNGQRTEGQQAAEGDEPQAPGADPEWA